MKIIIILLTTLLLSSNAAFAYLGPGVALGFLASIGGIILAILVGLFGILYFPIRRMLKKNNKNKENDKNN